MSHKVICPRGHVWDPSTLAGLPATDTPHCPICGESEPARTRQLVARLGNWCREKPSLCALSLACILLGLALIVTVMRMRATAQAEREAAELALLEARHAKEGSHPRRQVVDAGENTKRQTRKEEMIEEKWSRKNAELKSELAEALQARKAAVRQRDEQAGARKIAEDLSQTAEQVRQDAVSRRDEANRHLVKLHVVEGTRLMQSGDLSASLLWFAEALRLAKKEKLPEEAHRLRLAAILAQCPRPIQMWVHEKKINAVQISPDGKRVLTAGADGAATIWDATTGRRVGEPLQHMEAVLRASFSGDGKRILTAAADMTAHLWDLATGKEAFPPLQFMGPILDLSFSPDGRSFLTVAYNAAMEPAVAELHVWNAATGEAIREQALGSDISPRPAAFSPDGKRVLTICQDRCARVWDIATEKAAGSSFPHATALVHASFRADGKRVLTASADGTAQVWQTETGKAVTPPLKHGAAMREACYSPSGRYVLTSGDDRGVRVWDADTGAMVGRTLRHPDTVSAAVFSPDDRFVLTACDDGAARLWDYATGEEVVPALRHGGPIARATFTPSGDGVLTLSGNAVRLWDLTSGERSTSTSARTDNELSVFSPDSKQVIRVKGTSAQIYDTERNRPIGVTLKHKNKVSSAAFSADGRRVLTVSHQANGDEMEGRIQVWGTETGKPIGEVLVHPRGVLQASLSADGRRVLTACQDQRARLWDADKSALVGEPMKHKEDLTRALFTPNGSRIITVDVEGGMRLWDATKAEAVGPAWGHRKALNHLAFSPDGRQLVTASDDGTARVWEANTGQQMAETVGYGVPVLYAAFASDGKRIVTVSADRTARVWDAGSGKPLSPALRHPTAVSLGAFSADGRWLMTVAADGVRVWDAATGEPIGPPLKHNPANPIVRGVALGRDGRLVLAVGATGDPSGFETREFRADARSVDDLLLVAEVLSGQRFSSVGETTPFDGAALSTGWKELRGKHGKDFAPSAERATAWHRRGAIECERRGLWNGALRHLDRLMVGGVSADLYARRARTNKELRHWEAANTDYTKALTSETERWDLWAGRAEVEAALGRWELAAADYSKAIERKSDRAELWLGRGLVEAERGDWTSAADLGKAIHLGNNDVMVWHQHALTLLASGDRANYRRWCGRLVQHFGGSRDEAVARTVAQTCTLADGSLRDLKPLIQRAERAVTANPQAADDVRRLAVLLYRDGQFKTALTRLQEITRLPAPKTEARDFLLMAMSNQRLGHTVEAKKWLEKADRQAKEDTKDPLTPWSKRLAFQLLHREAETLMKETKR